MSFNAVGGPNPWIAVSMPRTPYSAALTSNDGVLTCLVFTRVACRLASLSGQRKLELTVL